MGYSKTFCIPEAKGLKKKKKLTFTLSVNKIIIYQFSMFKSLDSIASVHVVGIFMYLTISKFKQVMKSRKGLDYNTGYLQEWMC